MMKTLADIRRAMVVGSKWHCFNHLFNKDMGVREISIKRTNAVAFKTGAGNSWIEFPKASEVKIHEDGNGFDVFDNEVILLTYKKQ